MLLPADDDSGVQEDMPGAGGGGYGDAYSGGGGYGGMQQSESQRTARLSGLCARCSAAHQLGQLHECKLELCSLTGAPGSAGESCCLERAPQCQPATSFCICAMEDVKPWQ